MKCLLVPPHYFYNDSYLSSTGFIDKKLDAILSSEIKYKIMRTGQYSNYFTQCNLIKRFFKR